jgi:hypothetical protein
MENIVNYELLIGIADFGTVQTYVSRSKSPVTGVLFVASRELLADVAMIFDASVAHNPEIRERQLRWLFAAGHIVHGGDEGAERSGLAINMDSVPSETVAHVIFVPPYYLVHLPGVSLERRVPEQRAFYGHYDRCNLGRTLLRKG